MKLYYAFAIVVLSALACSDDDMPDKPNPVLVSAQDLVVEEGESMKPVFINVQLSAKVEDIVTLRVSTMDGTAKAGQDYIAVQDALVSFAAGALSQQLRIDIIGDDISESDEEFTLEFSEISGAVMNVTSVTVSIENDDLNTEFIIPQSGYTTPLTYSGMELIWQDEFDQAILNEQFWSYEIGNGSSGWGNNELEYYRRENTSIRDGHLVIEARAEVFAGFNYTSSRLITRNKFDFKYGRVDIRAALPKGQGLWPALWMLGDKIQQVGWPACGEIDIMEMVGGGPGKDDTVHGTAHWQQNGGHVFQGDGKTITGSSLQDSFHVFSLRWDATQIRWYVDDVLYYSIEITSSEMTEFHEDYFFIFNVAVGGNWPGSPNANTVFPQRMIVDYIRVFQPE